MKSFYFVNVSNFNYTIGLLRGQEAIGKVSNYYLLNVFLLYFFVKWVATTTRQFACYSSIFQIFVPRFCFENLTNYLSCSLKKRWDLDTEIVLFLVATTAVKDSINGVERCARSTIR